MSIINKEPDSVSLFDTDCDCDCDTDTQTRFCYSYVFNYGLWSTIAADLQFLSFPSVSLSLSASLSSSLFPLHFFLMSIINKEPDSVSLFDTDCDCDCDTDTQTRFCYSYVFNYGLWSTIAADLQFLSFPSVSLSLSVSLSSSLFPLHFFLMSIINKEPDSVSLFDTDTDCDCDTDTQTRFCYSYVFNYGLWSTIAADLQFLSFPSVSLSLSLSLSSSLLLLHFFLMSIINKEPDSVSLFDTDTDRSILLSESVNPART